MNIILLCHKRNTIIPINFNNMSTKFLCLVTLVAAFLAVATSDNSQDVQECTSSLVGLSTCLPYVGGTAKTPTPDCCTGLKQVLKTSKKCICVVVRDRNDPNLGLQINATLALGLPDTCKIPADLSDCPALLKLDPNSPEAQIFYQLKPNSTATSPAPAPAPLPANGPSSGTTIGSRGPRSVDSSCAKMQRWIVPDLFYIMFLLFALFLI